MEVALAVNFLTANLIPGTVLQASSLTAARGDGAVTAPRKGKEAEAWREGTSLPRAAQRVCNMSELGPIGHGCTAQLCLPGSGCSHITTVRGKGRYEHGAQHQGRRGRGP